MAASGGVDFGETSTNPDGVFGRNEPPSSSPQGLRAEGGYDRDAGLVNDDRQDESQVQEHNENETRFNVTSRSLEIRRPEQNDDLTRGFGALNVGKAGLQAPNSRSQKQEIDGLRRHINDLTGSHQRQQREIDGLRDRIDDLTGSPQTQQTEIDGLRRHMNDLTGSLQQQQREIDRLRRHINDLTGSLQQQQREIDGLRNGVNDSTAFCQQSSMTTAMQSQELSIRLTTVERRVSELEGCVCNGSYIWKVDKYQLRRLNATNGSETAVVSPAMYSSHLGYRLCLRINLNGDDSGVGKYIALYVHMMQGEYNDVLEWPFTGRVTLTILDQSESTEPRQHIRKSFTGLPNNLAFQKPMVLCNHIGYGFVEFVQIEQIREPRYIKNDTMLVKVEIKD